MLWFSTQICELLPLSLTFSLVQLSPLPPSMSQSTVCDWGGVLSPVGDHILQEFNTLYMTVFSAYKIARPAQKNLGGEGASDR